MGIPESSAWAVPVACFSLLWGVLSTLLWLWIVLRVVMALEGLSRAHAELANAVYRIAERIPVKDSGPAIMDWRSEEPPPRREE